MAGSYRLPFRFSKQIIFFLMGHFNVYVNVYFCGYIVRSIVFRIVQIETASLFELRKKKLQNISENSCLNYLFVFSSAVSIKHTHYLAFSFLTSKLYQNLIIVPRLYQSSRKSKHPPCEHRIRNSLLNARRHPTPRLPRRTFYDFLVVQIFTVT